MPERFYKSFTVTGTANATVYDDGIASIEGETRHLISVIINVSGYAGNYIEGWMGTVKQVEIPDYLLNTDEASGTNQYRATNKLIEIPIDKVLPMTEKFKVAIRCGATAKNIQGSYVYEIVT